MLIIPIAKLAYYKRERIAILETIHLGPAAWDPCQPLYFAVMGDTGSGLPAQQRVADQLVRWHERHAFQFIALLGDNIYPNGDALKYGEKKFSSLYRPLINQEVPFMCLLGNHDISGPLGVGYPTFWMSNQKEHMRFFKMPAPYYDFTCGPAHFFMLNTNRIKATERLWLSEQLNRSSAPWKIVAGHHPVFSSGFHGSTRRLKRKLKPILEKHNVPLYLSAHEHDYERFSEINGVTYIVSGGGGADLRWFRSPLPNSLVRESQHHFLACELIGDRLKVTVVNDQGEIIDAWDLSAPQAEALVSEEQCRLPV
ncbi:MAG: metallophosphoesterase [Vampirovibrio sp.]|nr:metallophosphoesterase [Vampirovibrio sp.]